VRWKRPDVTTHYSNEIEEDPVRTEQTRALAQLRQLARPLRLRVTADPEGFPFVPAKYGRIEWFDGGDLAVYCDHPRLFEKLWAIPEVRRHQTGDAEMRALFPPEAVDQVAGIVRAKRWGGAGRGCPGNLRRAPGHSATSGG
jgi:hypothetical protein